MYKLQTPFLIILGIAIFTVVKNLSRLLGGTRNNFCACQLVGLAFPGLAWPDLVWLGLAGLGLARLGWLARRLADKGAGLQEGSPIRGLAGKGVR